MEKKTKVVIGVFLGLLTIGGVGYYLYKKKKNAASSGQGTKAMGSSSGSENLGTSEIDPRYEAPVNPRLSSIDNSKVASYLSKNLSNNEIVELRTWLKGIADGRKKDPSKWGDANGLRGQVSDIGHALYQMDKGGQCSDCWNKGVLLALQDAQ